MNVARAHDVCKGSIPFSTLPENHIPLGGSKRRKCASSTSQAEPDHHLAAWSAAERGCKRPDNMPANQIQYSEKYYDDVYEYRFVGLLLSTEWGSTWALTQASLLSKIPDVAFPITGITFECQAITDKSPS